MAADQFKAPDVISLLRPLKGRVITVSSRLTVNVSDAANRTATAAQQISDFWSANTLVANSFTPPAGAGLLIEHVDAYVTATDASGKLQFGNLAINAGPIGLPIQLSFTLPWTFPAINGYAGGWVAGFNPAIVMPADVGNGPIAFALITNTDAGASHTYKRSLVYLYRLIFDFDPLANVLLSGASDAQG